MLWNYPLPGVSPMSVSDSEDSRCLPKNRLSRHGLDGSESMPLRRRVNIGGKAEVKGKRLPSKEKAIQVLMS